MTLKYMYSQIWNFLKFILLHGGRRERTPLFGWGALGGLTGRWRIWLHLEYDLFYYKNFTFSFIKGTHAHYVQFEECTANILVNLFKIGVYKH